MSHGRVLSFVVCALLAVLTVSVYAPVRQHDYIGFDDRAFLVDNANLKAGLSADGIRWAFTATRDGNWMPLTWVTFLADQEWFDLAPGPVHLVNVAFHVAAACLLFLAFWRMTGRVWPAGFVAAVFALHPLHVESVAWAIERKDVVSGFFFALLLYAYAGYAARPSWRRYAAVVGALTAGLLSKPMLVTAPFVLLLLDAWPLARWQNARRRVLIEKLPMFALIAAHSFITYTTQASRGATSTFERFPLDERVANALVATLGYLGSAVWPEGLAVFYPHPRDTLPFATVLLAGLALLALTGVALAVARRAPEWIVGWLWYGGMLMPVIGLVQVGEQGMADRYTYLPLIGATIALAYGVDRLVRGHRTGELMMASAAVAATAAMGLATTAQLAHWRDGLALFEHTVAVTGANPVALNGLASELLDRDRGTEAVPHLEAAIALRPDFVDAHVNLGIAYLHQGRAAEALPHLQRGVAERGRLREHHVEAGLGRARLLMGEPAAAIAHYDRAVALEPDRAEYALNRGAALLAAGRRAEARVAFERAEALGGDWPELHAGLARVHEARGEHPAAILRYRKALAARPDWTELANNLAWLLATTEGADGAASDEAVRWAEQAAAATDEEEPAILDTLAVAYHAAGRFEDERRVLARAARLARARGMDALTSDLEARLEAAR